MNRIIQLLWNTRALINMISNTLQQILQMLLAVFCTTAICKWVLLYQRRDRNESPIGIDHWSSHLKWNGDCFHTCSNREGPPTFFSPCLSPLQTGKHSTTPSCKRKELPALELNPWPSICNSPHYPLSQQAMRQTKHSDSFKFSDSWT